jgi:hypothetical protein
MSKHNVHVPQFNVLHDIETMTNEELQDTYDLEIDADGYVWDNLENQEFDNINDWGVYMVELEQDDNYGGRGKVNGKWTFDDERY